MYEPYAYNPTKIVLEDYRLGQHITVWLPGQKKEVQSGTITGRFWKYPKFLGKTPEGLGWVYREQVKMWTVVTLDNGGDVEFCEADIISAEYQP